MIKTSDGHEVAVQFTDSNTTDALVTKFVEIIGTVNADLSLNEITTTAFGDQFGMFDWLFFFIFLFFVYFFFCILAQRCASATLPDGSSGRAREGI